MLVRLASLAFAYDGIVTGVSLVGGSGPHEGNVQLAVASDDRGPNVTLGYMRMLDARQAIGICSTLGYFGLNRLFRKSPYPADVIEGPGFQIESNDTSTVIGYPAWSPENQSKHPRAVKCETDIRYLGCFEVHQKDSALANSTCPPSLNSNYSCIDRDKMTTESCLEYCMELSESDVIITYAGVRAGRECTCGFNTTELGDRYGDIHCNSRCSGDQNYSRCGGRNSMAAYNITSEPDEQEATVYTVYPSPDPTDSTTPADTTPADATTPAKPDDATWLRRIDGNAARIAGIGVGVGVVLLAVLAMVNVYVCARTRKQAVNNNMVSMTKVTTTATATTSTTSNKHQPMESPPTSDYYTRLDVLEQDQGNTYETPIPSSGAHSGVSVVEIEMEQLYENAR